jgi:hypothetical protein
MVLFGMLYTPLEREPERPFYRAKTFRASCWLAAVFLALAVAGYVFYPDWMWMYFVSTKELHLALQIAVVGCLVLMLYLLPFVAGYFLGLTISMQNKLAWWAGIILNLIIEGLLLLALWDRYNAVGTIEDFLNGTTVPLTDFHLLSVLLNGGGILLVVLGVWQWRRLRQAGNPLA